MAPAPPDMPQDAFGGGLPQSGLSQSGLLVELHMPRVSLRQLHSEAKGSLARFLLALRKEIGAAAEIDEWRISVLGILGRYKRIDLPNLRQIEAKAVDSE